MIRLRRLGPLVICVPTLLGFAPLSPEQSGSAAPGPGAKTWIGRYQEVEEYLRTAECVSMEDFGSGRPGPKRCTLRPGGPVARMAWKPPLHGAYSGFRESYKADIAAYELDKLLKMDMVPPAVERQLQGHTGAAILWVENVKQWEAGTSPSEPDRANWEKQMVRMTMFDCLIGNRDRNRANMLRDAAWNLILIDHSRAFTIGTELPHRLSRIDEEYWGRIQGLTRTQLDTALRPWLDDREIPAILDRREKMKAEIKRLGAR